MSRPFLKAISLIFTLLMVSSCSQDADLVSKPVSNPSSNPDIEAPITAIQASMDETELTAKITDDRPNIILIVADDLGYSDLGVYGSEMATPNLDMLASEGMMLTQFYAGMTCSPTRSMIMSGMDNHRAGLGVMGNPSREEHQNQPGYVGYLNFQSASLADLMSDAGYNTYMTGKWHLGMDVENGPRARGFKESFVSLDGAEHLGPWDWRGPQNANYRDGDEQVNVGEDFYSTAFYTERMLQYIEADRAENKPFFSWLAYTAPHWPLQAPKASIERVKGRYDAGYEVLYEQRFKRQQALGLIPEDIEPIAMDRFTPRWDDLSDENKAIESKKMEIYAAMVEDLDLYIGQVIDYLKEIDEFDNSVIMFISDNGTESSRMDLSANIQSHVGVEYDHSLENLGSGTSYVMYGVNWASATQTPLHRHKATGFEGGIRVPAFIHAPAIVEAGTSSPAVAHVMDLLPTFLDLAETQHPGTEYRGQEVFPVQGKSFLPLVTGQAEQIHADNEVIGWELFGHRSIRVGDWKLVWDRTIPAEQRNWQLFNLAEDPFEQLDLRDIMPEKFQEMVANWEAYVRDSGLIL